LPSFASDRLSTKQLQSLITHGYQKSISLEIKRLCKHSKHLNHIPLANVTELHHQLLNSPKLSINCKQWLLRSNLLIDYVFPQNEIQMPFRQLFTAARHLKHVLSALPLHFSMFDDEFDLFTVDEAPEEYEEHQEMQQVNRRFNKAIEEERNFQSAMTVVGKRVKRPSSSLMTDRRSKSGSSMKRPKSDETPTANMQKKVTSALKEKIFDNLPIPQMQSLTMRSPERLTTDSANKTSNQSSANTANIRPVPVPHSTKSNASSKANSARSYFSHGSSNKAQSNTSSSSSLHPSSNSSSNDHSLPADVSLPLQFRLEHRSHSNGRGGGAVLWIPAPNMRPGTAGHEVAGPLGCRTVIYYDRHESAIKFDFDPHDDKFEPDSISQLQSSSSFNRMIQSSNSAWRNGTSSRLVSSIKLVGEQKEQFERWFSGRNSNLSQTVQSTNVMTNNNVKLTNRSQTRSIRAISPNSNGMSSEDELLVQRQREVLNNVTLAQG